MKRIIIMILLVGFSATVTQAQSENRELKGIVKVQVDGLSCPFCAYGLEKKLKKIDGVEKIEIDVENAFVLLTIADEKSVMEKLIREKVNDAGFTPREITESHEE